MARGGGSGPFLQSFRFTPQTEFHLQILIMPFTNHLNAFRSLLKDLISRSRGGIDTAFDGESVFAYETLSKQSTIKNKLVF